MAKQGLLKVEETEIRFFQTGASDVDNFFSLTDMAKKFSPRPEILIQNWMRNRNTLEFLGLWEQMHNPAFNHLEFDVIRTGSGLNTFTVSVGDWTTRTGATGIFARAGRYGGTFAHEDIALEFGSWLEPRFKLMMIKTFKRLVEEENRRLENERDWSVKRLLSKINYRIHTDAVKEHLIPDRLRDTPREGVYFASEADLLNFAMFGITAKNWREQNPDLAGNLRDHASTEELLILSNLENLNAEFIAQGLDRDARLDRLILIAGRQMELLARLPSVRGLEG